LPITASPSSSVTMSQKKQVQHSW